VTALRSSRGTALFLLFAFLATPLAEGGVAVANCFDRQPTESEAPKEPKNEEPTDPQEEAVRKAWLAKFGDKWGLDDSSEAEVVCTCTCCGDRCPMGAACCCLAPKYPVVDSDRVCLKGPGCRTDSEDPPNPSREGKMESLARAVPLGAASRIASTRRLLLISPGEIAFSNPPSAR